MDVTEVKDPGPADDHYDQAERLIEYWSHQSCEHDVAVELRAGAQVHAILAVADGIRELTDLLEVALSPRDTS